MLLSRIISLRWKSIFLWKYTWLVLLYHKRSRKEIHFKTSRFEIKIAFVKIDFCLCDIEGVAWRSDTITLYTEDHNLSMFWRMALLLSTRLSVFAVSLFMNFQMTAQRSWCTEKKRQIDLNERLFFLKKEILYGNCVVIVERSKVSHKQVEWATIEELNHYSWSWVRHWVSALGEGVITKPIVSIIPSSVDILWSIADATVWWSSAS